MPVIKIAFDDKKISEADATMLSEAVNKIVSEATGINDNPVYCFSPRIRVKIAPVEIFIEMSAHKIKDIDALTGEMKSKLSEWKQSEEFEHPINLTLIPMDWKIEIGI